MKIHVDYVMKCWRWLVLACSVECPYANCSADSAAAHTATHTSPPNYDEDTRHAVELQTNHQQSFHKNRGGPYQGSLKVSTKFRGRHN